MDGYDVIGDVHGSAYKLRELLTDLDYTLDPWTGAYSHPTRQAIFVGDLVDRGPSQRQVLEIVKAMVDHGSAKIVMGNHEFNALAYSIGDPASPGDFLRPQTRKNELQHEAFLSQLSLSERAHYLAWFRTLPLWLDLDGIRVVHACWHKPSIALIEERLQGNRFRSIDQIIEAAKDGGKDDPDSLYRAVEVVLKGPEMKLSSYGNAPAFVDKDGHKRTHARIRWWKADVETARDLVEISGSAIDEHGANYLANHGARLERPIEPVDAGFTYRDEIPVLYGHYWRSGDPEAGEDWTERTACVDFSAVNSGTMVAYRWSEEPKIDPLRYFPHGKRLISRSSLS